MPLSPEEQRFLQIMMIKSFCKSTEVWRIFRMCFGVDDEMTAPASQEEGQKLVEMVKKINTEIRKYNMEIKKCVCEDSGSNYFILINTSDNAISRLASDFKVPQLEYFKKVVEVIVENENGEESAQRLLNLTNEIEHKITKSDAEDFLEKLVEQFWLVKSKQLYSLSARSIIELEPYLQKVFPNDVTKCMVCRTTAIKGEICDNCNGKVHKHCAQKYFVDKNMKKCPDDKCKQPWAQYSADTNERSQPGGSQAGLSQAKPKRPKRI